MRDYPTLNIEANYSKGLEKAIHHYTQIQIKVGERMQNVQKTIRSQLNVLITTYVNSCPNCQHFEEKRQYEVHAHVVYVIQLSDSVYNVLFSYQTGYIM